MSIVYKWWPVFHALRSLTTNTTRSYSSVAMGPKTTIYAPMCPTNIYQCMYECVGADRTNQVNRHKMMRKKNEGNQMLSPLMMITCMQSCIDNTASLATTTDTRYIVTKMAFSQGHFEVVLEYHDFD